MLLSLGLVFGASALRGRIAPAERRWPPNVIFVVWDTVRADHVHTFGYERPTSPWLDRWASDAVRYDQAVSASFWTVPSHASMFTGLAATSHGAIAGDAWLSEKYTTLAEWLGAEGYDTYAFTANPNISENTNLSQGFARVDTPELPPWHAHAEAWSFNKLIAEDASTPRSLGWKGKLEPGVFKDVGPVAGQAVGEWLDTRLDPEKPAFIFVNFMEAHSPRIPSMASRKVFADADSLALGLATNASFDRIGDANKGVKPYTPEEQAAMLDVYDASILDLDQATASLFEALEARGMLRDSIVVITSDHGENLGDHGLYGHNFVLYDSLVHVPLVVKAPGLKPGVVTEPVSLTGLFRLIAELSGLPEPKGKKPRVDFGSQPVVAELLHPHGVATRLVRQEGPPETLRFRSRYRAIFEGRFKLINSLTTGEDQLFDRQADPGELVDLSLSEPEMAVRLRAALDAWVVAQPLPGKKSKQELKERDMRAQSMKKELEALGYIE